MILKDIARIINDHKSMLDCVQEVALELTHSIGVLHTLTVKYAGMANKILDDFSPFARDLPSLP